MVSWDPLLLMKGIFQEGIDLGSLTASVCNMLPQPVCNVTLTPRHGLGIVCDKPACRKWNEICCCHQRASSSSFVFLILFQLEIPMWMLMNVFKIACRGSQNCCCRGEAARAHLWCSVEGSPEKRPLRALMGCLGGTREKRLLTSCSASLSNDSWMPTVPHDYVCRVVFCS